MTENYKSCKQKISPQERICQYSAYRSIMGLPNDKTSLAPAADVGPREYWVISNAASTTRSWKQRL